MEKIIAINDYESTEGYISLAGFNVLTTEQSIKLFIENTSLCCEQFGYFWCNDDTHDFIGASVLGVTLTDTALNTIVMKDNLLDSNDKSLEGCVMFVNIETDRGTLQFVAYNEHNGYYGHNATVQCTQLTHSETL